MTTTFKSGDKVTWNSPQGEVHGTVEKKVTSETHVKGHTAKPDAAHPEYLVKSAKTGKEAVHKPDALKKG